MKNHTVTVELDDPNAEAIASFMRIEFSQMHNGDKNSILDGVMTEIIGSRQIRLAGYPSPESQVTMRKVVCQCIKMDHPIPILVVSGPKKTPVTESIDIAELSVLRTLACLNRRVKAHFPPGIIVRIRLEDTTGYYLERGVIGLQKSIERYTGDFAALIRILGYDFIDPMLESTLMTIDQLREAADPIFGLLMNYLRDSEHLPENEWEDLQSWHALQTAGWQGLIPQEMRQYYHKRYRNLFPEYSEDDRLAVTGLYLAGTLARYQLNATGADPNWPGFFQINFAPPVPGIPKSLISTRVYYRTIPLNHSKRHMPYWRAKGILKLNKSVRMSLLCWGESEEELNPFTVSFSNGDERVNVRSDYLLCD